MRETLITEDGLAKLKQELEHLQTDKRREVADRIKEAREFGDISENAEYDDAKNEQAMLEQRILQLQDRLRRSVVIDEKQVGTDEVAVGAFVHFKDQKSGKSRKVPARRGGRGRPDRGQALERVPDRQGADRRQEERHRHRRDAARAEEEVQGHEDRSRVAASSSRP